MMTKEQYYNNKIILITGAASGIGKRFAEKVAEEAEVVLILWDRNPAPLKELEKELRGLAEVHISAVNIADTNHIRFEAEHLIKQQLTPDIIINCAGVVTGKMFHEHTYPQIEQTMNINATGSMRVVRAFLNEMMARGSGHIVNLASASGYIGNPRMSVYAASKWAVIGWTESLRLEMEMLKTGIRTTTVIPGYTDTGMFAGVKAPRLVPLLKTGDLVDRMLKGVARGKTTVKAPFMVRFVPFLKSVLPVAVFDWLAGNVFGVYRSMDSFTGRANPSNHPPSS